MNSLGLVAFVAYVLMATYIAQDVSDFGSKKGFSDRRRAFNSVLLGSLWPAALAGVTLIIVFRLSAMLFGSRAQNRKGPPDGT